MDLEGGRGFLWDSRLEGCNCRGMEQQYLNYLDLMGLNVRHFPTFAETAR